MIIEFFGMPGSGKTTIVNNLIKSNSDIKIVRGTLDHLPSKERIFKKFFFSLNYAFCSPSFYLYNLKFCLEAHRFKLSFLNDFLNITYLLYLYRRYSKVEHVCIFDQGLLQSYWSLISFSNNNKIYDNKKLFSYLDKVVIIEIANEISLSRLDSREDKRSRLQKNNFENINLFFEIFDSISKLVSHDKCDLLTLDGTDDILLNVSKLKLKFKL